MSFSSLGAGSYLRGRVKTSICIERLEFFFDRTDIEIMNICIYSINLT